MLKYSFTGQVTSYLNTGDEESSFLTNDTILGCNGVEINNVYTHHCNKNDCLMSTFLSRNLDISRTRAYIALPCTYVLKYRDFGVGQSVHSPTNWVNGTLFRAAWSSTVSSCVSRRSATLKCAKDPLGRRRTTVSRAVNCAPSDRRGGTTPGCGWNAGKRDGERKRGRAAGDEAIQIRNFPRGSRSGLSFPEESRSSARVGTNCPSRFTRRSWPQGALYPCA